MCFFLDVLECEQKKNKPSNKNREQKRRNGSFSKSLRTIRFSLALSTSLSITTSNTNNKGSLIDNARGELGWQPLWLIDFDRKGRVVKLRQKRKEKILV